ncbi:predicted protein [Histoplasma capsulatum G186AR]|uniref:Uncharacterized protein n=1 Tax=Ajellomyces capsulatus (strain G186AR / H82 / ATCC MYA-2454 / RMSCC 2432) TaxID=447093 RepID=C0NEM2_AJECG|nr:uncharacterized protein HCBG_01338 [Histoplasma capsulatum G186AR]EEH09693.1 predicted protein [Histoplasma capsulatum G186AR]
MHRSPHNSICGGTRTGVRVLLLHKASALGLDLFIIKRLAWWPLVGEILVVMYYHLLECGELLNPQNYLSAEVPPHGKPAGSHFEAWLESDLQEKAGSLTPQEADQQRKQLVTKRGPFSLEI